MDGFTICEKINNYITVQEQFLDKSPFQKKLSVVDKRAVSFFSQFFIRVNNSFYLYI